MAAKKKKVKKDKKDKKEINKAVKEVKDIAKKVLSLMGVKGKAEVGYDDENEAVVVAIETEDEAGLLIGTRGTTLNSLQLIIGLITRQRLGEWMRVLVDVADWREKEEERLKQLAEQAAERAVSTGEPQALYNLSAAQRRIIHLSLSDHKEVITQSHGEGADRYLVILRKE